MNTTILTRCGFAAALITLAPATPASAAKPVPVKLECSATRPGWSEPREFTVEFIRTTNKLREVAVNEKARVFTPSDATAMYKVAKGGKGVIFDLPEQRPGKWEGRPNGELDEVALKTKDGSASFALAPDEADRALKRLTWKAEMNGEDGQMLTAQGDGSCRVVSTVEPAGPAPKEPDRPASREPDRPTPKEPHKEIRIFGGRKGASAEGGGT